MQQLPPPPSASAPNSAVPTTPRTAEQVANTEEVEHLGDTLYDMGYDDKVVDVVRSIIEESQKQSLDCINMFWESDGDGEPESDDSYGSVGKPEMQATLIDSLLLPDGIPLTPQVPDDLSKIEKLKKAKA